MFNLKTIIFGLACLVIETNAFWEEGHSLVAYIAMTVLKKEHPEILKNVDSLLGVLETKLSKNGTTLTPREKDYPMVEASSFADDLSDKGMRDLYNESNKFYYE